MFKLKMVEKPELLNLKTNVEFPPVYVQTDHSKLENLDYKNSGHIGFASSDDLEKKVDKIDGKGLSTNDYTNDEKNKLAELENYTLPIATNETLGGIKVGENLTITEDGKLSASGGGGGLPVIYIGSDNSNSNPFVIDLDTLQNGTVIVLDKSLNNFFITMKGTNNVQNLTVNDVRVYMFTNVHSTTSTDYSKFEPLRLVQLDSRAIAINSMITYMTFGFFAFYVSGTVLVYDTYSLYSNEIVTNNKSSEISAVITFMALPKSSVNPTSADQFTRKGYVDALPTTYSGYDATKTQVLKNINGVLTWQDE